MTRYINDEFLISNYGVCLNDVKALMNKGYSNTFICDELDVDLPVSILHLIRYPDTYYHGITVIDNKK